MQLQSTYRIGNTAVQHSTAQHSTAQHTTCADMLPIFPAFWNQVTGRLQEAWGPAARAHAGGSCEGRRGRIRVVWLSSGVGCRGPALARADRRDDRAGRPMTAGRLGRLQLLDPGAVVSSSLDKITRQRIRGVGGRRQSWAVLGLMPRPSSRKRPGARTCSLCQNFMHWAES